MGRLFPFWFSSQVIRRVGGLEVPDGAESVAVSVIRRVGGLEASGFNATGESDVIRRVGGLEVAP